MRERVLTIPSEADRADLAMFVGRAIRLDEAAVVRLKRRSGGRVSVWAPTGFDALATRVVAGDVRPADTTAAGDELLRALAGDGGDIDPGFAMDSAWRGALPPESGFVHVDDVPARVLLDLAQRGAALAKEHGSAQGPPTSLLEQKVLEVAGGGTEVAIAMRTVFALTGMGFVPLADGRPAAADTDVHAIAETEVVRVRATPSWLRLDARFGSVYARRAGAIPLFTA
ncbi:hypothetical protein [Prescottella equi]|uniref:Uncharacterized protein n=1 Tax=Rhodococcus hoagii TaxID=43767 RepID=A0AAE5ITB5_RHOHA|nr:hypothetical protein [Prescottella equi]ERN45088.1 hypothetical protein H849_15527 [Prescottella equi NBRC 101255 = C 7]MBM4629983.1 hypothetical protein [Prescottella equi]ORL29252.1 hypothetical protein A6I89_03090 [Prescottella equi]ORM05739.1 hypothetical protein A5N73_02810 [Prescottella equi]ORM29365.1 hypothetical protein A5N68_05515 [Prescottella equi]